MKKARANVIKLFVRNLWIMLERLLDQAGKADQGQTLQLITKVSKIRTKKFYNIDE